MNNQFWGKTKRFLSGFVAVAMAVTMLPAIPAMAEDTVEKYPYTLFAGSSEEGAITVNSDNFCVNGNVATNGTITSSGNMNINGTKTENANEGMIYILKKLNYAYFTGENVDVFPDDYSYEEMNININDPMDVKGELELTGNINLSTGIKALENVTLNGEVKNTNNSVICSETGDIIIDSQNVNLNGLVYAPYGDVEITAQNLNLNNVIIIADTITFNCPSVNANYSSSMAELVGTESDIDVELYAFGEYNGEANSIDIEWYTNYTNSDYEVLISDDNVSYSSVATIADETTYQYLITEDFETRYFKISLTTNYGEKVESVPFVVKSTENGYVVDFLDSDGDGLADIYENMIGTDANKPDTDNDGLNDFQEVYLTGTDPLNFDSVTEGVSDADADSDGDGLTNTQEIERGTDPKNADTDDDNLSDYDEINVYRTDPLIADTDVDTIPDGDELQINLDPKNPETYGIPDAEYKITQTILADSKTFDKINTDENPYRLSIDITASGYATNALTAKISSYTNAISGNTAIVGNVVSLEYFNDSFENVTLKFEVNSDYIDSMGESTVEGLGLEGVNRLHAFKYDKVNNILYPIETSIIDNTVTVDVSELGDYCLIDLNTWLEALDIDFSDLEEIEEEPVLFSSEIQFYNEETDNSSSETFSDDIVEEDNEAPENYDEIIKSQIDAVIDNAKNETTELDETENIAMFSMQSSNSTAKSSAKRNEIDLVFVIDTSGSMSSAIRTAKSSMSNLVMYLGMEGIDVNVAVVSYSDYGCDGTNGAKTYTVNGSHWATTSTEASTLINQVSLYGCGHETPLDGVEMAHRLDFHENTTKFMVLITDEPYIYSNNRYGIATMQDLADDLKADEIYTSVVCYDRDASGYAPLYNTTNGLQINLGSDWPSFVELYIRTFIKEMKTFITVVPNSLEVISLKEVPKYGAQVNSDEDELWDYEEIDWSYIDQTSDELVLPTLSEYLIAIHGSNALETLPLAQAKRDRINALVILPITSNPEKTDSDGDYIPDHDDGNKFTFNILKNYFIAYDREGKDLYNQAYWMADYAYENENVEFILLHKKSDFVDAWNNDIPKYVNTIHLYLHGGIDEQSAYIAFYNEQLRAGSEELKTLKDKYVNEKVYLNSCQGGTKVDNVSVSMTLSESITNGTPVLALQDDYVDYRDWFDYTISRTRKSPYDIAFTMMILAIGVPPVTYYYNYNLFPRRHSSFGDGQWVEVSASYVNGGYQYHENNVGKEWEL